MSNDAKIINGEVYFGNGRACGKIEYDHLWKQALFIPDKGCKFSPAWLIDIAKTIEREYR